MKKQIMMIMSIFALVILAACGNNEDPTDNDVIDELEESTEELGDEMTDHDAVEDDDSDAVEQTNVNNNEISNQFEELPYHDIDIEVSYEAGVEVEINVDRDDDTDRVEAEIEDDINNIYLEGREAFDHIFPNLQTLEFTAENTEEEIIEQVLNAFDLADDYQQFEIEVYFKDGSKIDFEHRK